MAAVHDYLPVGPLYGMLRTCDI